MPMALLSNTNADVETVVTHYLHVGYQHLPGGHAVIWILNHILNLFGSAASITNNNRLDSTLYQLPTVHNTQRCTPLIASSHW